MSLQVISTQTKGDAKKLKEIRDRYELMNFDVSVDAEGNFRITSEAEPRDEQDGLEPVEGDKQARDEEAADVEKPDDKKEPRVSRFPLAIPRGWIPLPWDYPPEKNRAVTSFGSAETSYFDGYFRWINAVEEAGSKGFYALLRELGDVIQTPLLVLVLRCDEDQPYTRAEAFSIQPGSKNIQAQFIEWGDMLTCCELAERSALFEAMENDTHESKRP